MLHGAVERQRRLRGAQGQLVDKQRVVLDRDAARQRVERERRLGSPKGHVRDLDRIAHRLVLERELGVQVIEALRQLDARSTDRRLDHHGAVGDADGVDRDRLVRTGAIGLGDLFLHQPAQRPGVALTPEVHHRLVEADAVDRQAFGQQLEHVVVEPEILDRHHLAAIHRHADVLHLDAEEQVAAEPLDGQRAVQVGARPRARCSRAASS